MLLARIAETIARHSMFAPRQRVGVAVSGGADSVCLLHALLELAPRWDLSLSILHLNHGLRGEEARQDAEFVRALAARHNLPFLLREIAIPAGADNWEQAAREARLAFFRETLASGAAARIATGHTRSDQAETVLFRFLRGSGTAGLAGIRPVVTGAVEGAIVRPLLDVSRPEVEEFLRAHAIPWREDSTNASLEYARNRIRHELLPKLARDWNPAIAETLAQTADWALAEEAYWESEVARLEAGHLVCKNGAILVPVEPLLGLPLAASRRLVRRAMELAKGDLRGIDFRHISAALAIAASPLGHGRFQTPGLDVYRSFDWLRFGKPGFDRLETRNYRSPATVPGTFRIPGEDRIITLEIIEKTSPFQTLQGSDCVYNEEMGWLDFERLSGPLEWRNWRPGDQYQPVGSSGEEKLKSLFQQARVPYWERRHWPVLTNGGAIVWARRFGPAASLAAGPETRIRLQVREMTQGNPSRTEIV